MKKNKQTIRESAEITWNKAFLGENYEAFNQSFPEPVKEEISISDYYSRPQTYFDPAEEDYDCAVVSDLTGEDITDETVYANAEGELGTQEEFLKSILGDDYAEKLESELNRINSDDADDYLSEQGISRLSEQELQQKVRDAINQYLDGNRYDDIDD